MFSWTPSLDGHLDLLVLALPDRTSDEIETMALFDDHFLGRPATEQHRISPHEEMSSLRTSCAEEHLLLLEEGHCLRDQALAVCQVGARPTSSVQAALQPWCKWSPMAMASPSLPAMSLAAEVEESRPHPPWCPLRSLCRFARSASPGGAPRPHDQDEFEELGRFIQDRFAGVLDQTSNIRHRPAPPPDHGSSVFLQWVPPRDSLMIGPMPTSFRETLLPIGFRYDCRAHCRCMHRSINQMFCQPNA